MPNRRNSNTWKWRSGVAGAMKPRWLTRLKRIPHQASLRWRVLFCALCALFFVFHSLFSIPSRESLSSLSSFGIFFDINCSISENSFYSSYSLHYRINLIVITYMHRLDWVGVKARRAILACLFLFLASFFDVSLIVSMHVRYRPDIDTVGKEER